MPNQNQKLRLSNSRINNYLHCPKQYWWTYEQNLVSKEKSKALLVGDLTHELIYLNSTNKLTKKFIQPENLKQYVSLRFPNVDTAEALDVLVDSLQYANGFFEKWKHEIKQIISAEVHLEYEYKDYILYARVDDLSRTPDGRLWRGEYKTTSKLDSAFLSGLKGGLQAGICYKLLKEVVPEKVHGTIYSLIVKTKIPQYERMLIPAENRIQDMTEACILGVLDGIKHERFYPSMQCHYFNRKCDYLPLCKNDSKATREAFYEKRKEFYNKDEWKGGNTIDDAVKKVA